jgi:hypothetical protein
VKSDAKIIELAQERDQLKIRIGLLEKERNGLALASENMTILVGVLKDALRMKNMLLAACKDARDYIEACDEPSLVSDLQEAIDVAEGNVPEKKDEVGEEGLTIKLHGPYEQEQGGGDPLAS